MKRFFDEELDPLRTHLAAMGGKALQQVNRATRSLIDKDPLLAAQVKAADDELDRLEIEVDAEAVRYMGLRVPLARDLRLAVVGMRVGHNLERIGDEAKNIAKRVAKIVMQPAVKPFPELPHMAGLVEALLCDALVSFFEGNADKALHVCARDRQIDLLNKEIARDLAAVITARPESLTAALELIFVARSLERIGDHAVHIAEDVIYWLEGRDIRHDKRPISAVTDETED
jgi:phosphate transport system protein